VTIGSWFTGEFDEIREELAKEELAKEEFEK